MALWPVRCRLRNVHCLVNFMTAYRSKYARNLTSRKKVDVLQIFNQTIAAIIQTAIQPGKGMKMETVHRQSDINRFEMSSCINQESIVLRAFGLSINHSSFEMSISINIFPTNSHAKCSE